MHGENSTYKYVFFLGIGGIGMSALARYFKHTGATVCGYDKTPSALTQKLQDEGIEVLFEDQLSSVPEIMQQNPEHVLWVYTPAIPADSAIRNALQVNWLKRSEVLGLISRNTYCLAIAGTHGKTTTSVLVAHLLHQCNINFTAFLGGISANLGSNFYHFTQGVNLLDKPITVMEADEFDRSFHRLHPSMAIITSNDPDHLDIYTDENDFRNAFQQFANQVQGAVFVSDKVQGIKHDKLCSYSVEGNTEIIGNITTELAGDMVFNYTHSQYAIDNLKMGVPGKHNAENTVAAISMLLALGEKSKENIQKAVANFKGVARRFEFVVKTQNHTVIVDYCHHPSEINAFIGAVKRMYPATQITGIFQPHLFSRTRDFADGFAQSLAQLDQLWLMDIYPARELPIPGIDSNWLLNKINLKNKQLLNSAQILANLEKEKPHLLLIMGAGDIDRIVLPIKKIYETT